MRLNRFDTSKIKVRSSSGGGRGRAAGGVGCGTIIIALIAAVVFDVDPMQTIGAIQGSGQQAGAPGGQGELSEEQVCTSSQYATEACNALTSLNETWEPEFARANIQFRQPELNLFPSGQVNTNGCGSASSASGPFYCPADYTIYIDINFFDQLARMSGTRGDFARLYVTAHEYGHHIQNLTGIATQVRSLQQQNPRRANDLQVRMELQADCYAGVWAGKNRNLIEPGDIEEGMQAAAAIGDDRLTGGRVSSESFTHGTSRQRSQALRLGLQGDDRACDNITNVG